MRISSLLLILVIVFSACQQPIDQKAASGKLDLVNVFIGTGGHGHTFPGATVPYGMVQLSPDTRLDGWDACSGYHASDSVILGFSHTHLSGTGIGDYGDILFMPTSGEQQLAQGTAEHPESGYCSPKSKNSEMATPGYYTVRLKDSDVNVELTSTTRAGMHRYQFPDGKKAGLIIDVGHTLQSHHNAVNQIEIVNDHEIKGYKVTNGWARDQHVFFHAVFSEPFTYQLAAGESIVPDAGNKIDQLKAKALLTFENLAGKELLVKVGISAVDFAGAENNAKTEIQDWDFNRVKAEAATAWSNWLDKIDIEGGTEDQRKIFYTAMYHTGISPNTFSDADGRYRGMDKKIHQLDSGASNYTVFSLWDTFRAFHPLMTIINPARNQEWIQALIRKYDENGLLPMWELSSNETGTMIGYHSVSVIVDAYMKGDRSFDVNKAYQAVLAAPTFDTTNFKFPDKEVKRNMMPIGKYYNEKLGFVPAGPENEAVAKALEFAYNDWCIAQMAKGQGDTKNFEKFTERSKRYAQYFDKKTGFMRGLTLDKKWRVPFNPRFSNHREDDYVEGNAWQWSWFVPHDVPGLIALHGSKENFTTKLDSLFSVSSVVEGENSSMDISGLIGQYAHGNEPSHATAYLYNFTDQPWKTQELIDQILTTLYANDRDGLSGNEDCGQMSAWFILSSMGIYQVSPGNPEYTLGRPLFDSVTIHLENGKQFQIVARNNSAANKYVQEASINGKKLSTPFISHQDIMQGGTLEFVMASNH